jgi:hypothetical protein
MPPAPRPPFAGVRCWPMCWNTVDGWRGGMIET